MRRGSFTIGLALALCAPLAAAAPASAGTQAFSYTGAPQTWEVPAGVTSATFDLTGAASIIFVEDGSPTPYIGGLAGRAQATIPVTPGSSIQVNVGGQGDSLGGWNGGGDGAGSLGGSGGGGATDIRIGGTDLADRVLVAGGGGGVGICLTDPVPVLDGGDGGETGADGASGGCGGTGGGGATSAAGGTALNPAQPGTLGLGGDAGLSGGTSTTGGGGGGYYGGGGGRNGGAGGGGSSFGPPGTQFETGVLTQDGDATVTWTDPVVVPPDTPLAPAVPAADKPKCKRLAKKLRGLKGQLDRLEAAGTAKKRAFIRKNIRKTKRAQRRLGC